MPISPYVHALRSRIGHDLLLLPAVTSVFRDGERYLLARQRDSDSWGLIGGGVEPGEEPHEAIAREIREELGVHAIVGDLLGAYGGADLTVRYANGDRVSYISNAYACTLPPGAEFSFDDEELVEIGWFTLGEISTLKRPSWVDRMLRDAANRWVQQADLTGHIRETLR